MNILWKVAILISLFTVNCNSYRLPSTIIPHKYDLEIITYLDEADSENFYFTGKVKIQLQCVESTKNITLHAKDLQIAHDKTQFLGVTSGNEANKIIDEQLDAERDFLILQLENPLRKMHLYELVIEFEGKLINGLAGYYRSSYIDDHKVKRWLAVTQFEPTDARRAFPCFDEPSFKAKFQISLARKDGFSTISNMPLNKTEDFIGKNGWKWDRYQESVPMSTYLVAFIVSDLAYETANKTHSNVTFNIWARKNALDQVDFAKTVGPQALNFFEHYFDIKYPLPKQDMIAIPDFQAGAMENWGLITYREVALLLSPTFSSVSNKFRVASVIAHELAHQWFGNLVTMKWWTDLWLNEGFATYMASIAVNELFPKWNSLSQESITTLLRVYDLDSLKSSHPVSVPIHNPNNIQEIFDAISYKKGSFLIRMMYLFLGERTMQKGISHYLKENSYSNAEQDNLWHALTTEAHKNHALQQNLTVKSIMDSWTVQTGYPLINVTRNYHDGSVLITQERYFADVKGYETNSSECWWIPLSYTTENEKQFNKTQPKLWMTCPKRKQSLVLSDTNGWILFNIQASGLYRVNYDERNWKLLIAELKKGESTTIPEINRVLLIDNAMTLARIGRLPYDIAFDLLSYVKNDHKYLPWDTALGKLKSIAYTLKRTTNYGLIQAYIAKLVKPMYHKLGGLTVLEQKRDSLDAVKHQVLLAQTACKYGVRECVEDAVGLFSQWIKNPNEPNSISQEMRSVVYCTAVQHGGEAEWNFLWKKYKESNVGAEQRLILMSLGCSQKVWILTRYLEWSIRNDSDIRNQDMRSVFDAVSGSAVGYFIAKSFLETHVQEIYDNLSPTNHRISSYVSDIAGQVINESEQKEFSLFLHNNNKYFEKAKLQIGQALERMETQVQWHKKHYSDIERILIKFA